MNQQDNADRINGALARKVELREERALKRGHAGAYDLAYDMGTPYEMGFERAKSLAGDPSLAYACRHVLTGEALNFWDEELLSRGPEGLSDSVIAAYKAGAIAANVPVPTLETRRLTVINMIHGKAATIKLIVYSGETPRAAWTRAKDEARLGSPSQKAKMRRAERALCDVDGCGCGSHQAYAFSN